jgi:Skp family chaperone for outer membrane proteins
MFLTKTISPAKRAIFSKSRKAIVMAAAILALVCAIGVRPALAGPTFASVDLNKLLSQSKAKTAADAELDQMSTELRGVYQQQQQYSMLPVEKIKALGTILAKPSPLSDADKTTETQLFDQSTKDLNELTALQQKKDTDLTEADRLRIQTLTQESQSAKDALTAIMSDYSNRLNARAQELNQQILQKMKTAIAQVAQKQGIQVVFDSAVALYTSTDITSDVLTVMNK